MANVTTRNLVRNQIREYVLNCIDSEAYEVQTSTDLEKLQFLADTFKKEYVYPENIKRYGALENVFQEWCKGLPSSFKCDFENYEIIKLGEKWGIVTDKSTEKQIDRFLEVYWYLLAREVFYLLRKNGIAL